MMAATAAAAVGRPLSAREYTYSDLGTGKGLNNPTGQNNCFLNSAIQVLLHVDVFRRSFRKIQQHACTATDGGFSGCIFCALQLTFSYLQHAEDDSVSPTAVREALAAASASEELFQTGLMEDAVECFERILSRLHYHLNPDESEDDCRAPRCIPHQKFALRITEQIVCASCSARSNPVNSVQMVYYVSALALADSVKRGYRRNSEAGPSKSFGRLLKDALIGEPGSCPNPKPRCGATSWPRRTLTSSPHVVTVGLIWNSERPDVSSIMDVVQSISCSLNVVDMFHSVPADVAQHRPLSLVAVVCYYGQHYLVFLYHTKRNTWICIDDSYVTEVGSSWSVVVEQCRKGHYQPLLLVYADHGVRTMARPDPMSAAVHVKDESSSGTLTKSSTTHRSATGGTTNRAASDENIIPNCNKKMASGNITAFDSSHDFGRTRQPSYLAAVGGIQPVSGYLSGRANECTPGVDFPSTGQSTNVPRVFDSRAPRHSSYLDTAASQIGPPGSTRDQALRRRSEQLYEDMAHDKFGSRVASYGNADASRSHSNSMNNLSHWLQCGEDDGGNYIDPKVVESVLRCRQMKKGCTELKIIQHLPPNRMPGTYETGHEQTKVIYGSHQSLNSGDFQLPNPAGDVEFLGKLETEVDRDSGISGDRNSSSSTSSGLSVESSLTSLGSISDLTIGPNAGDRSSSGSTASNMSMDYLTESIARMTQKLRYQTPATNSSYLSCLPDDAGRSSVSDQYDSLSRRKNSRLIPEEPCQARPMSKSGIVQPTVAIPDDKCKQMLMEAESHAEGSGSMEKLGNLSKAHMVCQKAVDILQTAENIPGLSNDMLVHVRMKRNALVLNLRRLQRLISGARTSTTLLPIARNLSQTANNPTEPSHSRQLSKEEIGEILVKEIEGNHSRSSAGVEHYAGLRAAICPMPNANHRHLKYEEMVKQQLKTFVAKERDDWSTVGQNVSTVKKHCGDQLPTDPLHVSGRQDSKGTAFVKPFLATSDGQQTAENSIPSDSNSNRMNAAIGGPSATSIDCVNGTDHRMQRSQTATASTMSERRRSTPNLSSSSISTGQNSAAKATKPKKSVTFSDNIELVVSGNDDGPPIDYMAYALGIQQKLKPVVPPVLKPALRSSSSMETFHATVDAVIQLSTSCTTTAQDSDGLSADDSDIVELDETSTDGRVRCSLCRHKWVNLSETYCPDCSAYMSRLQAPG